MQLLKFHINITFPPTTRSQISLCSSSFTSKIHRNSSYFFAYNYLHAYAYIMDILHRPYVIFREQIWQPFTIAPKCGSRQISVKPSASWLSRSKVASIVNYHATKTEGEEQVCVLSPETRWRWTVSSPFTPPPRLLTYQEITPGTPGHTQWQREKSQCFPVFKTWLSITYRN
jgi:hypothetical protein